jgi:exodeoxyribonuclease VII small subunit
MPLYPGTGAPAETGAGNILNLPLSPGAGGTEFYEAFAGKIVPAVAAFAPDLIVISCGFDAHWRDPLAAIELTEEDFAFATGALVEVAAEHSHGRIVSVLEGGYDLTALAMPDLPPIETLSFEKALAELEQIVGRLERGDVPLAEAITIYERGEALKQHCEKLLGEADARVEKIRLGPGGRPEGTEPLDSE